MTGWTLEYIWHLPVSHIWAFVHNWHKRPPLHRLFAMFVGYGGEESSSAPPQKKGFEITPGMLQAFGGRNRQVCRQSQLPRHMQKTLDEFHSTPAYRSWREKMKKPAK